MQVTNTAWILLLLWPETAAPIQPFAWELPYGAHAEKERERERERERLKEMKNIKNIKSIVLMEDVKDSTAASKN